MKKLIILVAFFCLYGCVKDKPTIVDPPPVDLSPSKKVYIINEGNMSSSNASISLFDPANGTVVENIYNSQNNESLGDVAQSMNYINGNYYVVINNSGKIIVCDNQFKKTGVISGLLSPRYILKVSTNKAYVSDFKSGSLSIVDLNTNTIMGSIPCAGWTEKMILLYGKVYVTNMSSDYIYKISAENDLIEDSIFIGKSCGSIVVDKDDKIWALKSKDFTTGTVGRLCRIDHATNKVITGYSFEAGQSPFNLTINKSGDTLYYLNNDVYRMSVSSGVLPGEKFIDRGTRNFYGLGVNPNDFTIYVSDALDFMQRSSVYVYGPSGAQKQTFKAGINANGFYFE